MHRIDLVKLRKTAGISQRELADMLQVRPSFLSAIENGRSRLPEEKLDRIKEIFEIDNLERFYITEDEPEVPPHTHILDEGDSLTHLLSHFHDIAHRRNRQSGKDMDDLEARIEWLEGRNDRLSDRVDALRDEVDSLRNENLRLKELLIQNGIHY